MYTFTSIYRYYTYTYAQGCIDVYVCTYLNTISRVGLCGHASMNSQCRLVAGLCLHEYSCFSVTCLTYLVFQFSNNSMGIKCYFIVLISFFWLLVRWNISPYTWKAVCFSFLWIKNSHSSPYFPIGVPVLHVDLPELRVLRWCRSHKRSQPGV